MKEAIVMGKEGLKNNIWTTRVSRVNAEKRLLNKHAFIQAINIYYSCATIIFSIMSVIKSDNVLSLITVFMTISLLVTILYLNSLKYVENARDYRTNYTELHKLELELDDDNIGKNRILQIKKEYSDLMNASCNHISFDYYCTIKNANETFKEGKWKGIKYKYYFGAIWRLIVKFVIIILPFIIPILTYYLRGVIYAG